MIGATLSDRAAASNEGIKADAGAVSGLNMMAVRLSPGAISESNSSHLPPSVASKPLKPVTFPLGRSSRETMPGGNGIVPGHEDDRNRLRFPLESNDRRQPARQDDVGLQTDQLLRERSYP